MSLVVAHRISYGVRLSSDLRVTDQNATQLAPGYLSGVLKAVIVHRQVCIAFAGKPVLAALDAIRRLDIAPDSEVDAARLGDLLLDSHRQAGSEIDFLLATLRPTGLARIAQGTIEWDLPTAWIGDHEAFSLFQRAFVEGKALPAHFAELLPADQHDDQTDQIAAARAEVLSKFAQVLPEDEHSDLVVADRSTNAMQTVIDSNVETVGEAAILVVPRPPNDPNGAFAYTELSHASTGRPRPTHPGVNPLQAGSAAHGDFSFAILTPDEPGIGALAIYFLEGQLGLLYYPMKFDVPQRFPNLSVPDFKRAVGKEHRFSLGGIGIGAWI